MCKIVKKFVEWNSSSFKICIFLIYTETTPQNIFQILRVSSMGNKKTFRKEYGATG